MDDRIKEIVDFYGEENQLNMVSEEVGELLQAINKIRRFKRGGDSNTEIKLIKNLLEEMADVEIMIRQLQYIIYKKYMNKDETELEEVIDIFESQYINSKLKRQAVLIDLIKRNDKESNKN